MIPRERLRCALEHREADSVPIDFGAMRSTGISAHAYGKLRTYLNLPKRPFKVYDVIQQLAEPDEDVAIPFALCQGMEQAIRGAGTTDNTALRDWLDARTADCRWRGERMDYDSAGWLLDGFPRTEPQAEALIGLLDEIGQPAGAVVSMEVPDEEVEFLDERLGRGPVDILSRAYGKCQVISTLSANVWWVRYYNSMNTLILNTIEVTKVPAVVGAALMVLIGCLSMEEAYRQIEWKAVFLIAGMLPLGTALDQTGAAKLIAEGVVALVGPFGPEAVMLGLVGLTFLATCFVPTAALVVLMAPIALNTAANMGLSPFGLMMAIAMAASASFMTPVAHPANILVMGPGGYRFTDYLKIGGLLTLVIFVVLMVVLPLFWPLVP